MSRANTQLTAEHVYICGNSGTGKSSAIKAELKNHKRVLIFDPDDEYGALRGFVRVTNTTQLIDILYANKIANKKIAFVAEGSKAFAFWCDAAFVWGDCLAVAEEIADVTTTSKAPPAWGRLIRRGRKYGVQIVAVTQRPAEADKTILANAAYIQCFALGRNLDRVAICKEINVDVKTLSSLIPLEYLYYKRSDLSVTAGKLTKTRSAKNR